MPVVVECNSSKLPNSDHFDPEGLVDLETQDFVIVDTAAVLKVAQIMPAAPFDRQRPGGRRDEEGAAVPRLWDMVQRDQWLHRTGSAHRLQKSRLEHKLNIKMVRCEYSCDGGRLLVYLPQRSVSTFARWCANWRASSTASRCARSAVATEAKLLDGVRQVQALLHKLAARVHAGQHSHGEEPATAAQPDEISGVCGRLLYCLSLMKTTCTAEQNKKMPRGPSRYAPAQSRRHIHPR